MCKYYEKEEKKLVKISKSDAFAMRKLVGEEYVKKSHSKHPTYYLVEEHDEYQFNKNTGKKELVKYGTLTRYKQYRESLIKK